MQAELAAWNNGRGIDLEAWVVCSGNFRLAVGYTTIFWPEFVEFEGYILRKDFSENALRGFESQKDTNKKTVEWVMNHLHIDGIQYGGCDDLSKDKIVLLGNILKEIYQAKLQWKFPEKPCTSYLNPRSIFQKMKTIYRNIKFRSGRASMKRTRLKHNWEFTEVLLQNAFAAAGGNPGNKNTLTQ